MSRTSTPPSRLSKRTIGRPAATVPRKAARHAPSLPRTISASLNASRAGNPASADRFPRRCTGTTCRRVEDRDQVDRQDDRERTVRGLGHEPDRQPIDIIEGGEHPQHDDQQDARERESPPGLAAGLAMAINSLLNTAPIDIETPVRRRHCHVYDVCH